jgi:glycosyltransferase involved in cell wall biosynthesis
MTTRPDLSIVVPAYNEAGSIGPLLAGAAAHLDGRGIDYEIQVVDDGSSDGTDAVVLRISDGNPRVRVIRHRANRGYGAAIRSGLAAASGRHVLVSDGDGQFSIEHDLEPLWARRFRADLVLGFRSPRNDPRLRRIAGWVYGRVLVRLLLGGRFRDVNCGFKLVARSVLDGMVLRSTGALFSAELLTRARVRGATFLEVGVSHRARTCGRATGLLPRVILRMLRELLWLRTDILRREGRAARAGLRADCDAVESASA